MNPINPTIRDLLVIIIVFSIGLTWVMAPTGLIRNVIIAGLTTSLIILLWGIRKINNSKLITKTIHPEHPDKTEITKTINPMIR